MGNGMQKSNEILSPPSSPTATTTLKEDISKSKIATCTSPSTPSAKMRGRSPTFSTPRTKKSTKSKVNSGKKATPEKFSTPRTKKSPKTKLNSGKKATPEKFSTPRTKKSPNTKVNSGKKATPEKNNKNRDRDSKSRPKTPPSVEATSAKKRKLTKEIAPTQVSPSKSEINNNKINNSKKINNKKCDRSDQTLPSNEKRKGRNAKRTKNSTTATLSLESAATVVEGEDVTMDGALENTSNTDDTVSLRPPSTKNRPPKKEHPITLDARVHRLRHMGYIPGSVSALTPTSTDDGEVVVARTDGSYELKSITSSSSTGNHYSDNLSAPKHRLITIAETVPITGRKAISDNLDDDSNMEDDSNNGLPEAYPNAASSLCWTYPSSIPICIASGPNGNIWIVDFKHSRPIDVVSSGGGGIFDLSTCKFHGDTASSVKSLPFVAGACEDGSVRIWRIASGSSGQGKIQDPPLVTLPSAGAPVLSLAWKNVTILKQGRTKTFKTVVFAAIADGTIRKYGLDIEEHSSSIDEFNGKNNEGKVTDSHNKHYTIPNPPKSILRMTIESKGRKDSTKVWTLLLLQDNTLVVGTSLGQVQFWNGETGTLTQTVIQSNSQADVLKIVVNLDETKLFCSGVDSRVVCLERKKPPIAPSPPASQSELTALVTSHLTTYRPWKMTISQRPHTHDVKAMAIVTSSSNTLSSSIETLLTGGLDTKICSYSVSTFAHTQPQTWYPWPSATSLFSSTTCAPKGHPKLVSMQRHDRIELYQLETLTIKNKANRSKYLKQVVAQHPTSIPVGTIQLGGPDDVDDDNERINSFSSPLQASSLSPNGKFLAVSNSSSTYVFHLKYVVDKTNDEGSMRLQPAKLELPEGLQKISATTFLFTNDELYIGDSSGHQKVHVLRLPSDKNDQDDDNRMDVDGEEGGDTKLSMQTVSLPESQQSNVVEDIKLPIQSIHADGEFMVTSSHARDNAIHIFRRGNSKASYEHFWTLPNLGGGADARPAAVALLDGKRVAVATYRSHLYLLDIETRSLNEWSEQYGFPIREKKWTKDSLCGRGYPLRLIPQQNGRLVMASFGTFCMIDLKKPIPRRCQTVPRRPAWKNRRKFKPTVHNDDDDHDDNDDHWLESRVTTVVEDEYSHNDPDADDDDATESNNIPTSRSKSSSNIIPTPKELPDAELVSKNCTICSHYKNMLYIDFLGPKEMIIVEQPWSEIAETFPAALQRRIYGAD